MASPDVSWLVWADADDQVVGGAELRTLAASAPGNLATYVCAYDTALDGTGQAQSRVWRERLVRVDAGFEWRGVVHEYLAPPHGATLRARLVDPSVLRWIHRELPGRRTQRRNIELLLREKEHLEAAGAAVDRNIFRYLGLEHLWHGSFADAIPYLTAWREAAGTHWLDERLVATNALATCFRLTGDVESAIALGLEAFEARPDWAETAVGLMQSYRVLGRWQETLEWAERAAGLEVPVSDMPVEPLKLTLLPRLRAAEASLELGRPDRALRAFQAAVEAAPQIEALALLRDELEQAVATDDTRMALMCVNKAAGHYDTELAAFVRGLRSEAQERADSSDSERATTHAKRPYSSRVSSSTS
jgi:tetratricopeptide (TPR) repeat protein